MTACSWWRLRKGSRVYALKCGDFALLMPYRAPSATPRHCAVRIRKHPIRSPGDPVSLKQRLLAFVAIPLLTVIAALSGMAYWQMRSEIVSRVSHEIEAAVQGQRGHRPPAQGPVRPARHVRRGARERDVAERRHRLAEHGNALGRRRIGTAGRDADDARRDDRGNHRLHQPHRRQRTPARSVRCCRTSC